MRQRTDSGPRAPGSGKGKAARILLGAMLVAAAVPLSAQTITLDDFTDAGRWKAIPSDGVTVAVARESLEVGNSLRLDFDFHGGSGYAGARKVIALDLPENYEFTFMIRGEAPTNTLEFKLVDGSGDNVWWRPLRDFEFPREWRRVVVKKRQVEFAWGPTADRTLRHAAALELMVTAGTGGKGSVWIKDLKLTPLPPAHPYTGTPVATASSSVANREAGRVDAKPAGAGWHSDPDAGEAQWLALDFGQAREYGGVSIDWDPDDFAAAFEVQNSDDAARWNTVWRADAAGGARSYVFMPETESRHLRLQLRASSRGKGYGIRAIDVKSPEFGSSRNAFFATIAAESARGSFPRYLLGEQAFWTIVGVPGDNDKALLSENGAVEVGRGLFSIEPLVLVGDTLLNWANVERETALAGGSLPIPWVTWKAQLLTLQIMPFATGKPGASQLYIRYRLRNATDHALTPRLFLAIRPFQVNPSWQFLSTAGGVAPIRTIAWDGRRVTVDERRVVIPLVRPSAFGAAPFEAGPLARLLARGSVPRDARVLDPFRAASGVLAYDVQLPAGETRDISIAVPFHAPAAELSSVETFTPKAARQLVERELAEATTAWRAALEGVTIDLPGEGREVAQALDTALAHILINRDGAALQPGSRSYARAWARDGAMIAAALLRLGHPDEVREFLLWFASYQFPSGKVPCCVDTRGADPVPENDSHGELIYLAAEFLRHTGDRATVERVWPHVEKAVTYIDELRHLRRTATYRTPETQRYFGLLPQSISHEGYSDKPAYSYWDDFWTLRGLNDAVEMAGRLGKEAERGRFAATRDEFRTDLLASLRGTIAHYRIDFIPGAADRGDFDATSTTVAVAPGADTALLPQAELRRTFEKYWDNFTNRRDGKIEWLDYTPYEWRVAGTFVRLGWRDRANDALAYFMHDRRPPEWNQWPEVIHRVERAPKFLGDLPHAWVASDFIRSVLDFFAYERERDQTLVVGAGIPSAWLDGEGVRVARLHTWYGPLDLSAQADGAGQQWKLGGKLHVPPGGIVLAPPLGAAPTSVEIDGKPVALYNGELVIRSLPASVVIRQTATPRLESSRRNNGGKRGP